MPHFDYIIFGGGLAGSVLALSLLEKKNTVLVVDEPSLSSSSKVAAGLFQPMTFKRTIETWKGLESIQHSINFYKAIEKKLNTNFLYELDMARIFSSFEELNDWTIKSDDSFYKKLINENKNKDAELCQPKFGYGCVNFAGYLDVVEFLKVTHSYLNDNQFLLIEKFDYNLIEIHEAGISYKNFSANKILFAEGWMIKENPWFSYLPMKPVKGEVLTIKISSRNNSSIISSGVFSVPIDSNLYKVGSNYDWKNLNETPTEETKKDLLEKLQEMLQVKNIELVNHQAGIRPASHDRRPYLGIHPQYDSLFVFNGLGARGVSLAPYAAAHLTNLLVDNIDIPVEMNITRCQKYFHR